MNNAAATTTLEVTTLPMRNGWRVRITDGKHLQFVSGFEAKRDAEEWVRRSSQSWLAKLSTVADRL
jgi:hypothetical protein